MTEETEVVYCPVCYAPRSDCDPQDTALCCEHYSDWLWRKAEEERGLRVSSFGDRHWIDYTSRRCSYEVSAEEAEQVNKQIESIYERLQAEYLTPEKEFDNLVHFAQRGDVEAHIKLLARDPSNQELVAFLSRHLAAAMLKGFVLSNASILKLRQLWEEQKPQEVRPFYERQFLCFSNGTFEYIPF
jgi:hypothetical protein